MELARFVCKIKQLDKLGLGATWDTIQLRDIEAVKKDRQDSGLRPEDRKGYETFKMISSRGPFWKSPEKGVIDFITTRKGMKYTQIEPILQNNAKEIPTQGKEHTSEALFRTIMKQKNEKEQEDTRE